MQRGAGCTVGRIEHERRAPAPLAATARRQNSGRQQLLARRSPLFGSAHGYLDVFGIICQLLLESLLDVRLLDAPDLRVDLSNLTVDLRLLRFTGGDLALRRERVVAIDEGEEDRHHAVIVELRNRIELVVMTARAGDREPEEGPRGRRDHVVHVLVTILRILLLAEEHARADAMEAGGDQGVVADCIQLVAGELFHGESIVGLVFVEAADHVVAVAPGVGVIVIVDVA